MRTMKADFESMERSFGHCSVTWDIINYRNLVWKEKSEIESPRFSVRGPGTSLTNWKLILEHDSRAEGSQTRSKLIPEFRGVRSENNLKNGRFVMYLARSDSGRNTVCVDWRMRCLRKGNEQLVVDGGEKYFDKACRHGINIGVVFDFEREFQWNDALTFVCQMIVHERFVPDISYYSIDTNLSNLSHDFKSILKQEKFYDLKLKLGDKCIKAHKSMLFSRCKSFVDVVKEDDEICLPATEYDGLVKIFDYVYSGDLSTVSRKPSIALYDAILLLSLPELEEYYTPEEHSILTTINAHEMSYVWFIRDFSMRDEYCLSSPILFNSGIDTTWQIHFYPRGISNQSGDVSISVENTEGKLWDDACVQCAAISEGEAFQTWKTLQKSTEERFFEIGAFMERDALIGSLDNDVLRLGFKVRMCTGNMHTFRQSGLNMKVSVFSEKDLKPLEKLSFDMSLLRKTKAYTDIILQVGNERIKAHKYILMARSRVFSDMIEKMEGDCLVLSNIKHEVLKVLVDYMYFAVLEVSNTRTVLDVYEAAEKFAVSCLREECSRVLRGGLALETVCDVLNLADDYGDNLMKQKAMKFIKKNIVNIRKCKLWKKLQINKPPLCGEIDKSSAPTEELVVPVPTEKAVVEMVPVPTEKAVVEMVPAPTKKVVVPVTSEKTVIEVAPAPTEKAMVEMVPAPTEKTVVEVVPGSSEKAVVQVAPSPTEKAMVKMVPEPTEKVVVPGPTEKAVVEMVPAPTEKVVVPGPSEKGVVQVAPAPTEKSMVKMVPAPTEKVVVPGPSVKAVVEEIPAPTEKTVVEEVPAPAEKSVSGKVVPKSNSSKVE